jgi:cytoskeletal protein CcmA (bactofilin family)
MATWRLYNWFKAALGGARMNARHTTQLAPLAKGAVGGPMFGTTKKSQAGPPPALNGKPETVIGPGTSFVGTLKSDGNIRIDGSVEGDVEILGNLIVGESGRVIATIKAQNVHISGAVKGEVTAVEQLEISPTGKVWGDITTAALHIEPGGLFRGQSAMSTNVDEPLLLEAPRTVRAE